MKIGKGAIERRNGIERKVIGFVFLVGICIFWLVFLVPLIGSVLFLTGIKKNISSLQIDKMDMSEGDSVNLRIVYKDVPPLFDMHAKDIKIGIGTSRNERPRGFLYCRSLDVFTHRNKAEFKMNYTMGESTESVPDEFLLKIENRLLFTFQATVFMKLTKNLPGISIPVVFPYTLGVVLGNNAQNSEKLVDIFLSRAPNSSADNRPSLPVEIKEYKIVEDHDQISMEGLYQYKNLPSYVRINLPRICVEVQLNGKSIGRVEVQEHSIFPCRCRGPCKKACRVSPDFKFTMHEKGLMHARKCAEMYLRKHMVELTFRILSFEKADKMPYLFQHMIAQHVCNAYINRLMSGTKRKMNIVKKPLFELKVNKLSPSGFVTNMIFHEEIFPFKDLLESFNNGCLLSTNVYLAVNGVTVFEALGGHVRPAEPEKRRKYLMIDAAVGFPLGFTCTSPVFKHYTEGKGNAPVCKSVEIVIGKGISRLRNILFCGFGLRWRSEEGFCVGFEWIPPAPNTETFPEYVTTYNVDMELSKEEDGPSVSDDLLGADKEESLKGLEKRPAGETAFARSKKPFAQGSVAFMKKVEKENFVRITWNSVQMKIAGPILGINLAVDGSYIDVLASPTSSEWSIRSSQKILAKIHLEKPSKRVERDQFELQEISGPSNSEGLNSERYKIPPIALAIRSRECSKKKAFSKRGLLDEVIRYALRNLHFQAKEPKANERAQAKRMHCAVHLTDSLERDYTKSAFVLSVRVPRMCAVMHPEKGNVVLGIVKTDPILIKVTRADKAPPSVLVVRGNTSVKLPGLVAPNETYSPMDLGQSVRISTMISPDTVKYWPKVSFTGLNGWFYPCCTEVRMLVREGLRPCRDHANLKSLEEDTAQDPERDGKVPEGGFTHSQKVNVKISGDRVHGERINCTATFEWGAVGVPEPGLALHCRDELMQMPNLFFRVRQEDEEVLGLETEWVKARVGKNQVDFGISVKAFVLGNLLQQLIGEKKVMGMSYEMGFIEGVGPFPVQIPFFTMEAPDSISGMVKAFEKMMEEDSPGKGEDGLGGKNRIRMVLGEPNIVHVDNGRVFVPRDQNDQLAGEEGSLSRETADHFDAMFSEIVKNNLVYARSPFPSKDEKCLELVEGESALVEFSPPKRFVSALEEKACTGVVFPVVLKEGFLGGMHITRTFGKAFNALGVKASKISAELVLADISLLNINISEDKKKNSEASIYIPKLVWTHREAFSMKKEEGSAVGEIRADLGVIFPSFYTCRGIRISPKENEVRPLAAFLLQLISMKKVQLMMEEKSYLMRVYKCVKACFLRGTVDIARSAYSSAVKMAGLFLTDFTKYVEKAFEMISFTSFTFPLELPTVGQSGKKEKICLENAPGNTPPNFHMLSAFTSNKYFRIESAEADYAGAQLVFAHKKKGVDCLRFALLERAENSPSKAPTTEQCLAMRKSFPVAVAAEKLRKLFTQSENTVVLLVLKNIVVMRVGVNSSVLEKIKAHALCILKKKAVNLYDKLHIAKDIALFFLTPRPFSSLS
ncbi:uncharacterized protein NEMAJ01_0583 [Nematocida major]|uniref:uncharacterized protein n=1 Tax=Nematocida major TaxID=1912982 RepID=UPI002008BBC8|nr:uncharacterized protein NEMAJ01_0583 [Nematocida major]KAH9385687.1 hypothetical protein NEMAJ01_0583 [Nematocida major]